MRRGTVLWRTFREIVFSNCFQFMRTPTRGRPGNPACQKGAPSLNPKGRPKGALGKVRKIIDKSEAAARSGADPFDMLLAIGRRDPEALKTFGIDANDISLAEQIPVLFEVLKYIRAKPATRIEGDVSIGPRLLTDEAIASMPDEAIDALLTSARVTAPDKVPVLAEIIANRAIANAT